ncbi:YaiI/YqxD family protein [Desemzia sp. RIT804]|uniref:YaiI/YqxD family protein n=1 Tax=Desemzia sp. RIT 804 TaxID=2810209 RepID=UPI0019511FB6|nr:YaiI/YqxD family protein [Desemzia sp. RIT 804]MBM6614727.1 YaiI/YqxD family protein [Desemzia sp. RIT 804]
MHIYIDADASPVKNIVIEEGVKRGLPVTLVTSISHYSTAEYPPGVQTVYVDTGAEAADYRIMQLVKKEDLLITQDYGLASLCLAKGCLVLHHTGFRYTVENIDQLLQSRYLSAMVRKSGKRTKGPKPFTNEDRDKFRESLKTVLDSEE